MKETSTVGCNVRVFQALLAGLLSLSMSTYSACGAATPAFQDAVSDYTHGQFYPALKKLSALERSEPNNASVHYYMALCRQNTGQLAEAKSEYQWVYAHGDAGLKKLAQVGYAALGNARSASSASQSGQSSGYPRAITGSGGGSQSSGYPRPAGGGGGNSSSTAAGSVAYAGTGSSGSAGSQSSGAIGVKKIIEFSTSWCPTCKEFAPIFEDTKTQFHDIEFSQLDAEDPSNHDLVSRYNVRHYPTLVYLGPSGQVLMNRAGAPNDKAAFVRSIQLYKNAR